MLDGIKTGGRITGNARLYSSEINCRSRGEESALRFTNVFAREALPGGRVRKLALSKWRIFNLRSLPGVLSPLFARRQNVGRRWPKCLITLEGPEITARWGSFRGVGEAKGFARLEVHGSYQR